jgi:hypothetical protein
MRPPDGVGPHRPQDFPGIGRQCGADDMNVCDGTCLEGWGIRALAVAECLVGGEARVGSGRSGRLQKAQGRIAYPTGWTEVAKQVSMSTAWILRVPQAAAEKLTRVEAMP